jgi:hypothetical protein
MGGSRFSHRATRIDAGGIGSVYRHPEICGPEELPAVHAKHKQRTAMWRGSPALFSIEET